MDSGRLLDAPKPSAGTLPILVVLGGPSAHEELGSLYEWVRGIPEIRQHALIDKVGSAPRTDGMGAYLDTVRLVVDSGFQTANLLLALVSWREARRARASITLHRDGRAPVPLPSGSTVGTAVDPAAGTAELEAAARRLDDPA